MSDHPLHLPPRTPAAAQPPATYRPTSDEAELIRLSQEWMKIALVESVRQHGRRVQHVLVDGHDGWATVR